MDITWYGQSCFKIKGKIGTVVIDPFDPEKVGLKLPKDLEAQVVLSTHDHADHNFVQAVSGNPLVIKGPGEYERSGITIEGIATYHDNAQGSKRGKNIAYHLMIDGISLLHLGDLGHILTEEQSSKIESVDILMVPVGGVFTIDAESAAKVVAQVEPKIVIPMHYALPGLKFQLEGVELFLKEMGVESLEPTAKLVISKDKLPEETAVVLFSKS